MRVRGLMLVLLVACSRHTTVVPDASPEPPKTEVDAQLPPLATPFRAVIHGRKREFAYGVGKFSNVAGVVLLATYPLECGKLPSTTGDGVLLNFSWFLGPWAGGHEIPTVIAFDTATPTDHWYLGPSDDVALTPIEVSARVRGKLAFSDDAGDSADGAFDVPACPPITESPSGPELPKTAHSTPAAGLIANQPFVPTRVLAEVRGDKIEALVFSIDKDLDCNRLYQPESATEKRVWIRNWGISTKHPRKGTQQPARAYYYVGKSTSALGDSWVRLNTLSFEPGSKIVGEIVAREKDGHELDGTFTADVCSRRP